MSLTNLNFLDREAQLYKNSKTQLETSAKTIQQTIETNTKQEVDAVNSAIKNLNNKVEQILNTETIKMEKEKIECSEKQMESSIKTATETFFKVREVIRKKNLSKEDQQKYEKQLYQKIIEKFLTKEEIDEFERLIRMGPMILIGNPMSGQMSGQMSEQILGPGGPIDAQMMGGPTQRRLRY